MLSGVLSKAKIANRAFFPFLHKVDLFFADLAFGTHISNPTYDTAADHATMKVRVDFCLHLN